MNQPDLLKTMLQAEHDKHHRAYMDGEVTFSEFYIWLAEAISLTQCDLPVTLNRIRKSTDPYLNDITLSLWDRRDYIVRDKAFKAGMHAWSLSDTVCTLKAYGRHLANKPVP